VILPERYARSGLSLPLPLSPQIQYSHNSTLPGVSGDEGYLKSHMLIGILAGILIGLGFLFFPILIGMIFFFIAIKKLRDGIHKKNRAAASDD
jgi:hypothetical protein